MNITELKEHWEEKYPNLVVSLFKRKEEPFYIGILSDKDKEARLSADTISDLIQQGEDFIRDLQ